MVALGLGFDNIFLLFTFLDCSCTLSAEVVSDTSITGWTLRGRPLFFRIGLSTTSDIEVRFAALSGDTISESSMNEESYSLSNSNATPLSGLPSDVSEGEIEVKTVLLLRTFE